ncbi:hypothetical protein BC628DRAFT_1312982 [Trametes gibbosa]|nr:hypothetical protein BC628DRAFT_1312982 [Trametes gibbosa]
MSLKALFYAYVLGGLTFLPLAILAAIFYTVYTSVPVGDPDGSKFKRAELEAQSESEEAAPPSTTAAATPTDLNDLPRPRKGWLTVRRTFEETPGDASYVGLVKGFLDARSKDPKRSRPKDMWYVALKGKVLYLYEDEGMTECEAAVQLSGHEVVVFPEGLPDGELFAKRNAICLKPRAAATDEKEREMPSVTREMKLGSGGAGAEELEEAVEDKGGSARHKQRERERLGELEKRRDEAREQALDAATPWFIFVRSAVEMEDWYLSLVHAADNPPNSSTLEPLRAVFKPDDMSHLVATLDEQPDVIPMRWLNALIGRIFFSYYRTQTLEAYIIGRLMKKISKVKRPGFLTDIVVREVSVGNRAPTLSKPMLKELTKEGDAALEVHLSYKGEVRITVEATATINLGARFKTYTVKLVLALVLREIEGNLLVKVKRPPSSRIWYAFTQMPKVVLDVEPVVSDRQITWGMILSTIESKVKEVIQETVVLPNMDDIAFFESSQYSHRGGIWGDASRRERESSKPDEGELPEDGLSTPASAPLPDTSKVDPGETELPPVQRSRSAEVEKTTSTSPPDTAPLTRSATTDATTASVSGSSTTARRRSWFTGVQEESDSVPSSSAPASEVDENESRGRTSSTDPSTGRRSSSTPNISALDPQDDTTPSVDPEDESQYLTPTASNRRSSSQHSRSASSRAASFSSHAGDFSDDGSDSQMATYQSKSPAPSGSSPRQMPTSPSSFLQTLKSRAGDKQALSNTAKEAMRKWGVNWGNFRRDSQSTASAPAAAEEVPDAGHGDQRHIDSRTPVTRPSYAEVRAAVEERRESHRAPLGEAPLRSNQLSSEPIPVPSDGMDQEGTAGASPAQGHLTASSPATGTDEAYVTRSATVVMLPVDRSESHVSTSSREGASQVLGLAPEEPERPPSPIHTQPPPPKTMTIPGIHASHRGEVMSMGYVPPQPVTQEPKKAPLQSVYRLWKNPGAGSSSRSEAAPVSQTGFSGRDQDSAPSSEGEGESSPPPPRPVPPPLPPRQNSTHVLQTKPDVPRPPETAPSAHSPASAALQSIVSKDRRVKRASFSPPSSPGRDGILERGDAGTLDLPSVTDRDRLEVFDSPTAMTPTPSSPPTPPTPVQVPNGRGPPPALPPRRVRTSA